RGTSSRFLPPRRGGWRGESAAPGGARARYAGLQIKHRSRRSPHPAACGGDKLLPLPAGERDGVRGSGTQHRSFPPPPPPPAPSPGGGGGPPARGRAEARGGEAPRFYSGAKLGPWRRKLWFGADFSGARMG